MPYATIEQMQDMELGCTGEYVRISGVRFERLVCRDDPDLFGWIAHHVSEDGLTVDWDRVPQDEAVELGLIIGERR